MPSVWSVMGRRRVLATALSYREQTLLLLYADPQIAVPSEDLFEWTEHSNTTNYRRDVLRRLHQSRSIEWDRETEMVLISPLGVEEVEDKIIREVGGPG